MKTILKYLVILIFSFLLITIAMLFAKGYLKPEKISLFKQALIKNDGDKLKEETEDDISPLLIAYQKEKEMLDEKAASIAEQEKMLEQEKLELQTLRSDIESILKNIKTEAENKQKLKNENVQNLSKMYSSMGAEDAAKALEKLDIDTVAAILLNMSSRKSSKIMNYMTSEYVAKITTLISE